MPSHIYMNKVVVYKSETWGTETSKYPQEKKTKVIPQVVASERGTAQIKVVTATLRLQDCNVECKFVVEYFWKVKP